MFRNLISKLQVITAFFLAGVMTANVSAQAPELYSTVNGRVWEERVPANGIFNSGEPTFEGFLVKMNTTVAPIRTIASAITDANGHYTLYNYEGSGSYTIQLLFPNSAIVGIAQTAATLPGSQSHFKRLAGNTTAVVNVLAPGQSDTVNGALMRNSTYQLSCGSFNGSVTPIFNQTLSLPKVNYDSLGVFLWDLGYWSAVRTFHNHVVIQESQNIDANMQMRIGVQTTSSYPTVAPLGEMYAQSATTLFSGPVSGMEVKNYYNLTNASVFPLSDLNYPPINTGVGTIEVPVEIGNSVTLTSAMNFVVTALPTVATYGGCLVYYTSTPINLIQLSGFILEGNSTLTWSTSAEQNCKGFEIEYAQDSISWQKIGFEYAKSDEGDSKEPFSYNFHHKMYSTTAPSFYRLKQIGKDEKETTYSNILVLDPLNVDTP